MQIGYTNEAWATMAQNPQDRVELVRPIFERAGARVINAWFAFGKYDLVVIAEAPDNVTIVGLSIAISAGGATASVVTTPLISIEEGIEAMRRAGSSGYRPPAAG
jgi:uncharacterized protein with GYD domain